MPLKCANWSHHYHSAFALKVQIVRRTVKARNKSTYIDKKMHLVCKYTTLEGNSSLIIYKMTKQNGYHFPRPIFKL